MSSSKIGFTSYVEIATSMVIQDTDRERLNQSVSKLCGLEQRKNSTPDFAADDIEIHSPRLLKIEWEKRIREWQELLPDRGQPVEECRSLNDFQFCAFFLQHPFVAMSLWNVMQTFYTLDRLVCGTSKESLDRINEWESMQPFEYLEAPRVEKRWRYSLQELLKSIDNSSHQDATTPQPEDLLSGISNIGETMKGGSQDRIKGNTTDTLLRRIDGIYFGISKLENAKRELRRNLRENLKGVRLVDSMLEAIAVAAKRRFSMIDTYLKIDDHHRVASSCPDEPEDVELPGMLATTSGR
jgi:hypothetical protein